MTPDESVNEIVKLADAAEAIIGHKWAKTPGKGDFKPDEYRAAGSMACYLPNGEKGTNYPLLWIGSAVTDPEKTITEIQAAWEKLGVKATITKVPKSQSGGIENVISLDYPPYLTGTDPDGYFVSLTIYPDHSGLNASTHCIPIPDQYLYHPGDSFPPEFPTDTPSTGTENQPTP